MSYKEKLKEVEQSYFQDPDQLSLFKRCQRETPQTKTYLEYMTSIQNVGIWMPVRFMQAKEFSNLGDVIGFHPAWVNLDFNESGLRICCWAGERWVSAKWGSICDEYVHVDSEESSSPEDDIPLFICRMPDLGGRLQSLIDAYYKKEE